MAPYINTPSTKTAIGLVVRHQSYEAPHRHPTETITDVTINSVIRGQATNSRWSSRFIM